MFLANDAKIKGKMAAKQEMVIHSDFSSGKQENGAKPMARSTKLATP